MSNKIKKAQNRKNAAGVSKQGLLEMSMEYITAAIMAAMCIAVSFYAKDGYNHRQCEICGIQDGDADRVSFFSCGRRGLAVCAAA